MRIFILLSLFILASCDEAEQQPVEPSQKTVEAHAPDLILTQSTFADLPAWEEDDLQTFVPAFKRSCGRIVKRSSEVTFGVLVQAGTYGDWQAVCLAFDQVAEASDTAALRAFFEEYFTPHQVSADDNPIGLFTGYYEASLNGSSARKEPYTIPLHKRPDDLVMVQLGDFRPALKGNRIAGRVKNGRLKPYENRAQIVAGDWPHEDEVLIWVDDAVDAFFVQIQGSGLVQMDDGSVQRIGYAGQNGHPYYAIGRELIKIGALTKENVSMQSIRAWLAENPTQADEIMNTNKSYVFFRKITGDGPLGAEGIALTGGRSLAVDRTLMSYGVPLWVDLEGVRVADDSENAIDADKETTPIRRLMIAQDTGGAITGPVRGDVFWGYGKIAEDMAGKMISSGRYWVLLPKKP
ncbi:MAG: murein transglycosylase [Alphaproteobacteria bacterium]|nr:MAG: murein transglycosylase [Alphaproteobacteria bacterium]